MLDNFGSFRQVWIYLDKFTQGWTILDKLKQVMYHTLSSRAARSLSRVSCFLCNVWTLARSFPYSELIKVSFSVIQAMVSSASRLNLKIKKNIELKVSQFWKVFLASSNQLKRQEGPCGYLVTSNIHIDLRILDYHHMC